MKKVFLTLLLAGTAVCAQAQVHIGPKLGVNFATSDLGDRADKDENGVGYAAGVNIGAAADIRFFKMFSFAPEISFSQKGYKYSIDEQSSLRQSSKYTTKETFKANYIDIPLLLRATFGNSLKGYVNAGPTLSYWLNGRYNGQGVFTEAGTSKDYSYNVQVKFIDEYTGEEDLTDDIVEVRHDHANRFEIGASFGGGVMVPVAGRQLLIDARYTFAGKDIYNEMKANEEAKNSMLSLSLMYLLGK